MANAFLGEASAKVNGRVYTLRLDFNALCAFEEKTGEDALAVVAAMEKGKFKVTQLRTLVLAMLQKHHPDATAEEAGDILSEDSDALQRVLSAARPEVDQDQPGNRRGLAARRPG
jgi:hypothetical protein